MTEYWLSCMKSVVHNFNDVVYNATKSCRVLAEKETKV